MILFGISFYLADDFNAFALIEDGKIIDVNIKDVKGKRPLPNKELKEFKVFTDKFKEDIVQKWVDYFVYHKSITCIRIEGKVK